MFSDLLMFLERNSFLIFLLLCRLRFRRWTEADIRKYQRSRIIDRIRFAMANSPFYRELYSGCDITDISSLPTINKKIVMENLDGANTLGLKKDELLDFCLRAESTRDFSRRLHGLNVGMSSGTSGNKGVEITSTREENLLKAAFFARFSFPRGQKINLAFILRVTSPAFSLNIFGHRLTYISQLDSIENIVDKLNKLNPNIISGPPSMLKLLAGEHEAGRLNVTLSRLVSYAEVLYPDVKEYLAGVFHCEVHEIYKCTEGAIAISCKYGNLHVNEDIVAIEMLNRDGSPTPPGMPCHRLIITDLHKSTLPVIRYELNDVITLSTEKCPCGSNFRVIEKIHGRADDMLWGIRKSDGKKHFIYQDYITRTIISVSDDIEEFQVIQKQLNYIMVRLMLKENTSGKQTEEAFAAGIRKVFAGYGCMEPEVEIVSGQPVPNINSGKLSRVICEIKNI